MTDHEQAYRLAMEELDAIDRAYGIPIQHEEVSIDPWVHPHVDKNLLRDFTLLVAGLTGMIFCMSSPSLVMLFAGLAGLPAVTRLNK